jgi:3-methyladenine DNA glycosylase AlkD
MRTAMTKTAGDLLIRLEAMGDAEQALILKRFFKTGPGQYGAGDKFLGIRVPAIRKLTQEYQDLALDETVKLLHSSIHEARLLALLILICLYRKGNATRKKQIFSIYLGNTQFINNWDLVDVSAEHIVGTYLQDQSKTILYRLALSEYLWERRIAIIATFHYIKQGDFSETLRLAEELLVDSHDLIHKAVGWMLREVGKRDLVTEELFLQNNYRLMPRTMLRYAIEKFPEDRRQQYLRGLV